MHMKIAIINTLPVPSGNASVNRFLSYGKELVQLGVRVHVLSSAAFEDNKLEGIEAFSCGRDTSMFGALRNIILMIKKNQYDAAILVSNSLLLIYPLALVCRLKGVKLIQEKSEFPFVLMKKGLLSKCWAWFYTSTTYKIFDGLIVMTKPLMEYFKPRVRKDCKLIEVPMTVDVERFAINKNNYSTYGRYIAYCGNMSGNKDGVLNLIEAFSLVEDKLSDIKLLLIGGTNSPEQLEQLKSEVQKKGIKNIVFYGRATREQMPELLVNAKLLALARPSSLQSTGGFPTKLGEYLATGNPVVVTSVGDIPNYLNETNAYIVEPNDNKAFADAILEVFNDYSKAETRGLEGKKIAYNVFNAKVQSERLNSYLQSIV